VAGAERTAARLHSAGETSAVSASFANLSVTSAAILVPVGVITGFGRPWRDRTLGEPPVYHSDVYNGGRLKEKVGHARGGGHHLPAGTTPTCAAAPLALDKALRLTLFVP
jgi:hypothetical protein